MSNTKNEEKLNELKDLGNAAVKEEKYEEAVLHYTQGIKIDPTNYTLYSNRSYAFLKIQQYYHALEDAKYTISLNQTWAKGYFRRGEVEYATCNYADAYKSYIEALRYKPDDLMLINIIEKVQKQHLKDIKAEEQIPWLGAGIGIILGAIIVIADFLFTSNPTHPLIMAIVTILISLGGYGVAKIFRYHIKCQRKSLLDAPADLMEDIENVEEVLNKTPKVKYTKSQARQRYKKGKL